MTRMRLFEVSEHPKGYKLRETPNDRGGVQNDRGGRNNKDEVVRN
jgi:hypothetical protein